MPVATQKPKCHFTVARTTATEPATASALLAVCERRQALGGTATGPKERFFSHLSGEAHGRPIKFGSSPINGTAAACAACEVGVIEGRVRLRCFVSAYGVGTALTGGGGPGSVGQSTLPAVYFPGRGDGCIAWMTERARERGRWPPPPARTAQGAWLSCLRLGARREGGRRSLRPDRDGDLQVPSFDRSGGPSGVISNGELSFSLPTLPARPKRSLKLKAPCAVLPGWARRAAQGCAAR